MIYNSLFWSILKGLFIQKQEQASSKNYKSITFEYNGRSGYAVYRDRNKTTRFYTEVGGGKCIFYMVVPSAAEWESHTGYNSAEREDIIRYIAEESLKKQTNLNGSYYKIEEKNIVFYQK